MSFMASFGGHAHRSVAAESPVALRHLPSSQSLSIPNGALVLSGRACPTQWSGVRDNMHAEGQHALSEQPGTRAVGRYGNQRGGRPQAEVSCLGSVVA